MIRTQTYSRFSDFDISLFKMGQHFELYDKMGAHPATHEGEQGCYFAVWAPSAHKVEVIGDWNYWDGSEYPLQVRWDASGIWEGWLPNVKVGHRYKYRIYSTIDGQILDKADPYARRSEAPSLTASIVADIDYQWQDEAWVAARAGVNRHDQPMSIYEVHMGSWRWDTERQQPLTYVQAATALTDYVVDMGFTHVELMPLTSYPFDLSWGYQATGYFSPTERYGTPEELMYMVDCLHQAGVGVILDWVPAHFPSDEWALASFDGSHLYEHPDRQKGYHPDWKSLIFNYERAEVRAFLISSALYWLKHYHIDALRVDAVASMLYLDYSREEGEWTPNIYGGNEYLAAVDFLKDFNKAVYHHCPGVQTIAEESTSFSGVTRPVHEGGLGFGIKWMMGWMNDTLLYFARDPIHRQYHHNEWSFSLTYAFTENFMLPLSHDEVVHGKGPLLYKMPGDDWQRLANLRLLYLYMWTHPGSKLLFMGGEIAQTTEWHHDRSLDWHLLDYAPHRGVQSLVRDLNGVYRSDPALHTQQYSHSGWQWIAYDDSANAVLAYLRRGSDGSTVLVVLNGTPTPLHDYRLGVPSPGKWQVVLDSDADTYGGAGVIAVDGWLAEGVPMHGQQQSISISIPPLGGMILRVDHNI